MGKYNMQIWKETVNNAYMNSYDRKKRLENMLTGNNHGIIRTHEWVYDM